jgi:AraC family transcriptional regulator of adaptative response / DNA-3-methyladenine glycosylase II
MIEVALGSGFGSVRRFNETFQRLYGRPPSELRRRASATAGAISPSPEISLLLPYRPPYDWVAMIRFLEARAIAGLEMVTKESYSRVIDVGEATGSITVTHAPDQSALRVAVRFPQWNVLPMIIARVRRMFDLSADPGSIASALSSDPILAPLISARPGLRLPGGWDGFEIAVRAVLGQQITLKAATHLAGRVVSAVGVPVKDTIGIPGLTHAFPRPDRFNARALARLGMPKDRAAALEGVAAAIMADPHLFDPRRDLADAVARLRNLRGIGEWTAQYIAMRALGESDAFLAADVGVQRSFASNGCRPGAAELLAHAERWRPWRAYAVLHLWMADAAVPQTSLRKETNHALAA